MSEYLNRADVELMSHGLHVYDVDQGGWEHEEKGLDFNLGHILKEVVRARRKDMFDERVLAEELAPDAMQYALRIRRHARFRDDLVLPRVETKEDAENQAKRMRTGSRRIGSFAVGEIVLADYLHKLDHESEEAEARQRKLETLPRVSQALMYFAQESANEFRFNPRLAFFNRLEQLRERFNIPQPKK